MISFNKIISSKRLLLISTFVIFIFLLVVLNISFSIFSSRSESDMANIKVAGMNYSITVNGISNRIITATKNDTTKANIVLTSLNNRDSKYELTYKVCSDSSCTNFIEKPSELTVEYSSRTIDPITESITSSGTKQIRIAITNTGATTYYIKLDINAGFIYNTLALKNLITTEYNEEDVTIAAIIDGEISTTFPTTNDYIATVACETNNGPSNASGSVTWNGTKWVLSISEVDSGRTICNVYFKVPLNNYLLTLVGTNQGTGQLINENGYRYEGLNPNNYVTFNNELWRIIGVFDSNTHGITDQNLVKIIRNDSIGDYAWDSGNVNNWNTSSLKTYLNNDYYNGINQSSKNLIVSVTWKLGGYSDFATTANMAYTAERGTTVYSGRPTSGTGNVGLMYPSDYGYAVLSSTCQRTKALYDYYDSSGCYNQNWLYKGENEWTLTPNSSSSYNVCLVYNLGSVVNLNNANTGFVARPSLYLKSNTIKISGEGTSTNPYIIGE